MSRESKRVDQGWRTVAIHDADRGHAKSLPHSLTAYRWFASKGRSVGSADVEQVNAFAPRLCSGRRLHNEVVRPNLDVQKRRVA
jgi:hypothetical protein